MALQPHLGRDLVGGGVGQSVPVGHDHEWKVRERDVGSLHDLVGFCVFLHGERHVWNLIHREKRLELEGRSRPLLTDHAYPRELRCVAGLPVVEEVIEDRVELHVRWVPRLHDVVVEADVVDRADGGLGVGIGR